MSTREYAVEEGSVVTTDGASQERETVTVPREDWESLQERVKQLEELIEIRGSDSDPQSIWVAGHPIGKIAFNAKQRSIQNEQNVDKLMFGEVEAEDVVMADPEAYIPIQQNWNAVKAGVDHGLSRNQELAARIWPHYRDYCDPSGGVLKLTSPMVNDIIERELDMGHVNPNTRKRAMKFIAKFSDGLVEFDDSAHTNKLTAEREEWIQRMDEMAEAHKEAEQDATQSEKAQQDADTQVGRLAEATPEKDYGVVRPDGGEGVN